MANSVSVNAGDNETILAALGVSCVEGVPRHEKSAAAPRPNTTSAETHSDARFQTGVALLMLRLLMAEFDSDPGEF